MYKLAMSVSRPGIIDSTCAEHDNCGSSELFEM